DLAVEDMDMQRDTTNNGNGAAPRQRSSHASAPFLCTGSRDPDGSSASVMQMPGALYRRGLWPQYACLVQAESPPDTGMLETALDLHRRGLRLVPLVGKEAFLKGWQHLQLGAADIRSWSKRGVNWGAITGDPLIVLDTDTDEAERWIADKGIDSPVVVQSGGGGKHRWFIRRDGVEIHSRTAMHKTRGLDLKGWNSYI